MDDSEHPRKIRRLTGPAESAAESLHDRVRNGGSNVAPDGDIGRASDGAEHAAPEDATKPDTATATAAAPPPHLSPDLGGADREMHEPEATAANSSDDTTLLEPSLLEPSPLGPSPAGPATSAGATPALSKSALKKLRRREQWESQREARKQKRKDERARKRERARAARRAAAGGAVGGEGEGTAGIGAGGIAGAGAAVTADGASTAGGVRAHPRGRNKKKNLSSLSDVTVVLDCGFDGLMTEREIVSLSGQITRCYADNCQAERRVGLVVAGFARGTRVRDRFDGALQGHWRNWKGIRFEEGGLADVLLMLGREGEEKQKEKAKKESVEEQSKASKEAEELRTSNDGEKAATEAATPSRLAAELLPRDTRIDSSVVYLTADSPHTLSDLAPRGTYIVGALVDRNRHKGVCYKAASAVVDHQPDGTGDIAASGGPALTTARLPIAEHMRLASRQVLATNHVVEILLGRLAGDSWGTAFASAVPKRKGGQLIDREERGGAEEGKDGEGGAEGEPEEGRDGEDGRWSVKDGEDGSESEAGKDGGTDAEQSDDEDIIDEGDDGASDAPQQDTEVLRTALIDEGGNLPI